MKSLFLKYIPAIRYSFLFSTCCVLLLGCAKWDLPLEKSLKVCQDPSSILIAPDVNNPLKFSATLVGKTEDIAGAITWKVLLNGQQVLSATTKPTETYVINLSAGGDYDVIASCQNVCENKLNFSAKISSKCVLPTDFTITPIVPTVDNKIFVLNLTSNFSYLKGTVSWFLVNSNGAKIFLSTVNPTTSTGLNIDSYPDGDYTVILEGVSICGDNVRISKAFKILNPSDKWVQKTNTSSVYPSARYSGFAFTIGDFAYLGGGQSIGGGLLKDWYEFNSLTGVFRRIADFPGDIYERAELSFSIGNNGYVFTFNSLQGGGRRNSFWQYSPFNNTWTEKAVPGNVRSAGFVFSIENKGYLGGGVVVSQPGSTGPGATPRQDFWEYNPDSNKWIQKANLPGQNSNISLSGGVGFSIGNKGYLGLGVLIDFTNFNNVKRETSKKLWEYDPSVDKWIRKDDFPGAFRSGPSLIGFKCLKNGNILGFVGLGQDGISTFKDFYAYEQISNSWSRKADLPTNTITSNPYFFSFSIGQKIYVGYYSSGIIYEYTP